MWKQIEKPKTMLVTKALVKEFVEMTPAPYDRPLSERRLQVYQRILSAKEFRPVTWASVECRETDETYRVNGKHTSIMLSGMSVMPEFYVTVERYQCATLHEVAELYNTFDSRLGSRTSHDMNMAFAATMPELKDIPHRLIHHVVTAASFAKWGTEYWHQNAANRAELLLDNGEFAVWLSSIMKAGSSKKEPINRSPVVSAMYATWNKAKAASTEFWSMVRDETHPDRNDPTRTISRYLSRVSVCTGRGAVTGKESASVREMYVKCLHAWNAWRRKEETDLKYFAASKLPIPV